MLDLATKQKKLDWSPETLKQIRGTLGATAEQGTTLPPACFTDAAFYDKEVETIFKKEWLCVAHVSQLPNPGDYLTTELFGEPIVITRDRDNVLHALSSVCRHRWMPVVEGAGNTKTLSCPYHRWTYALDGQLMGAPLMEGADGFDPKECRLPSYALEVWQGWIFVNMDVNAAPLAPRVQALADELAPWNIGAMKVAGPPMVFDSPFNWKVLVDNFMEAYHHIAIHKDTLEPGNPAADSFIDDVDAPFSVLRMPARDGEDMPSHFPPVPGLTEEQKKLFCAYNLYPNHLFATLPDHVVWYQFEMKEVDRFTLNVFSLYPPEIIDDPANEEALTGMAELGRIVHMEDIQACEGAQKGLLSDHAAPGHLSLLERAIWQHHRWILAKVQAGAS